MNRAGVPAESFRAKLLSCEQFKQVFSNHNSSNHDNNNNNTLVIIIIIITKIIILILVLLLIIMTLTIISLLITRGEYQKLSIDLTVSVCEVSAVG